MVNRHTKSSVSVIGKTQTTTTEYYGAPVRTAKSQTLAPRAGENVVTGNSQSLLEGMQKGPPLWKGVGGLLTKLTKLSTLLLHLTTRSSNHTPVYPKELTNELETDCPQHLYTEPVHGTCTRQLSS